MINYRDLTNILKPILRRLERLETQEFSNAPLIVISARLNATQNIPNGVWTTVNFVEVIDTDNQYVSPTVTISQAGTYLILAQIQFDPSTASGAGQQERSIRISGSIQGLASSGANANVTDEQCVGLPPIIVDLIVGNTITIQARQDTGVGLNIFTDAGTCYFIMIRLKAA